MIAGPKVHVRIEAEESTLCHATLSLAATFSYEIFGADPSLKEFLIRCFHNYLKSQNTDLGKWFPSYLSPFQKKVLLEMGQIPFGQTMSYRELGEKCGMDSGARAIGGACRRNPLPFLIPCHRIIRTDGSLGGFSPDLEIKRRLLTFEKQPAKPL